MAQLLGRWSADELRAAADIAREKGVPVCLLPDGSISIGAGKPAEHGALEEGPPEPLPNAFSPATLAKRWHCSERHIRNMIEKGQLGHFHLGGKLVRIPVNDVERIENANSR